MSKLTKLAGVLPFAHLLGIKAESDNADDKKTDETKEEEAKHASWAKKAETDDERKQKDEESDDDYAKRMEELDDKEDKAKSKAEDDEADAKAAAEDDKEGKDGEEAKAERSRCAKIMAHGIKHGNAAQAGVFAFNTRMSAAAAVAALNAGLSMTPAKRPGLGERMAATSLPKPGVDAPDAHNPNDPQSAAKATAARIIASAAKARGEKV